MKWMRLTDNQRNIVKNFNWLFVSYVYRFLIGFITLVFVTRYLGPTQYGIYAYALSSYAFLELTIHLLNVDVIKKELIHAENHFHALWSIVLFRFFSALLVSSIALIILWSTEIEVGDKRTLLSIFAAGMVLKTFDTIVSFFGSQMRHDLESKNEIFLITIFNLIRGGLVLFKGKLHHFAIAVLIRDLTSILVSAYLYKKEFKVSFSRFKLDLALITKILKKSLPLFLATVATTIFTKIDQIMIGKLLSDTSVGVYAVVIKLSEPWIFLAAIVTQSLYPTLVIAYSKSFDEFKVKVHKALTLLLYISLGIILGTNVFGAYVVETIFGEKYSTASPVLEVHIFYLIFVFWIYVTNHFDIIVGSTRVTLIKTVGASIINVFLNLIFIPRFGIIGASYATICSYAFSAFFINLLFSKTRSLFLLQLKAAFFWKHKWFYS